MNGLLRGECARERRMFSGNDESVLSVRNEFSRVEANSYMRVECVRRLVVDEC